MTQHILSLSYGKDSLACLGAIERLGWPLDRIIHAEVWATDTISADLPPMVEFKAKADEIIKARWGIEVEHLCATRNGEKLTYEKLFYHVPKRKPGGRFSETSNAGFPYTKGAWCNDRLKTRSLDDIARGGGLSPGSHTRVPLGATPSSKCECYPRLSYAERELVYQRSQNPSFPAAPLHKGQIQILCSTSVSLPMSQSGS